MPLNSMYQPKLIGGAFIVKSAPEAVFRSGIGVAGHRQIQIYRGLLKTAPSKGGPGKAWRAWA